MDAMVLGAGFSKSAGLPLTRELFDELPVEPKEHHRLIPQHEVVREAWHSWKNVNPDLSVEHWLLSMYGARSVSGSMWPHVMRFLTARLVLGMKPHPKAEYYHDVFTSVKSDVHRRFWQAVISRGGVKHVITTNYDLLVEQGLRETYSSDRSSPMCFYCGWGGPRQILRKMVNLAPPRSEDVPMGTEVALYKLHGSLNWAEEPHDFKIHADVRAAFRVSARSGTVAIVPPIPEKDLPPEFTLVWKYARKALKESESWLVCGYSFPDYDQAVEELFKDAFVNGKVCDVILMDPSAESIAMKLKDWRPSVKVRCLPGIPDAFAALDW